MPTIAPWAFVLAVRDHAAAADYFRDVRETVVTTPDGHRIQFGQDSAGERHE